MDSHRFLRPQPERDSSLPSPAERIAKVIARAGVCSRREAERRIFAGRVCVDGVALTTPAVTVMPEQKICIDGEPLPRREAVRLWLFHKPAGIITTHYDPQGRPTVFDKLASYSLPRVISVGRLDLSSEGLLLLTNCGEVARYLEYPSTGWARRYRVRLFGSVTQKDINRLQEGTTVGEMTYKPLHVTIDRALRNHSWLTMTLREGKNREIRKIAESFGWKVTRLIRVSYGPFQLGTLPPGDLKELSLPVLKTHLKGFFQR